MLSDESSSDSETGRFKGQSEKQDDPRNSSQKEDRFKYRGRGRASESDRFRKEFERKRDERDRSERFPKGRDRIRYSRHSPPNRRRYSRERSPNRRLHDRHKHSRESRARSRSKGPRSHSKERTRRSRSKSRRSPDNKKEESKHSDSYKEKRTDKQDRKTKEKPPLSPDYKNKKSEIQKPLTKQEPPKKKSESPVVVEEVESDHSVDVQPGSYYNMIPAVIKDKSEESSEIDSSDDERLRAKLLNLEKELRKTRKKKHKKKHKRKTLKSSKDQDNVATVEVSSTTDIKIKTDVSSNSQLDSTEVTSTQKSTQKESSEEGEISSEDSQTNISIDPTDLRHKLRRSIQKSDKTESQNVHESVKPDVCGPVLPPHLQKKFQCGDSVEVEGPILPPHLQKQDGTIGPTIPEDMRKILAETEREIIKYESSDEDIGIGPLPVDAEAKWSDAHKRLEERALDMKIRTLEGHSLQTTDVKSREKWMLELPEAKAKYLGLEARTFRAKEGPDMSDRSSWTDTPEEKARKSAGIVKEEDAVQTLKQEAKARQIANRDDEQEKEAKKHKKKHKRDESLLEIHQKKLKKKKKKEEKESDKKERRPFSRDIDLEVNRFDEAQKKSIIKKAQALDSRFSRGEAKYL